MAPTPSRVTRSSPLHIQRADAAAVARALRVIGKSPIVDRRAQASLAKEATTARGERAAGRAAAAIERDLKALLGDVPSDGPDVVAESLGALEDAPSDGPLDCGTPMEPLAQLNESSVEQIVMRAIAESEAVALDDVPVADASIREQVFEEARVVDGLEAAAQAASE